MKNSINALLAVSILNLSLITSCATRESSQKLLPSIDQKSLETNLGSDCPKIPINIEDAFFPLHESGEAVFYSWEDCKWLGLKCKYAEIIIPFSNKEAMKCFFNNDFGFKKRSRP